MHHSVWQAKITTTIALYGHQVIGVTGSPPFTYTIGLSKKHGYELLVFGIPMQMAAGVINAIAKKLDEGTKLELGVPDDRWFNLPVMFKKADNERAREYVVQADEYYNTKVEVVQMVLSDRAGRLPTDPDFDVTYMSPKRQPLL